MRSQTAPIRLTMLAATILLALAGCVLGPVDPQVTRISMGSPQGSTAPPMEIMAQRPFSDFVSSQGTTSLFFPPFPDYIGWANNNPQTRFALVDFTGLAAQYLENNGGPSLGTQVSGSVSERTLSDGRAEVTVVLRAARALSWAVATPDIATNPVLFGYRAADLLVDPSLTPGLSTVNMKVVFKNDAPGASLPDLVNAFILGNATPAQELVSLSFYSDGVGPLHSASGAAEGTPGRLQITQTGLFMAGFHGAVADGFPAERVNLRAVGNGTMNP